MSIYSRDENRRNLLTQLQSVNTPQRYQFNSDSDYAFCIAAYISSISDSSLLLSEEEKNELWEAVYIQHWDYKMALINILQRSVTN